ncbi:MAG: hypothetical protein EBV03_10295 [Proteobacteria bacterium]|nr:hypothetical protein [Pseudomonadota bacterium]
MTLKAVEQKFSGAVPDKLMAETVRQVIGLMVDDVLTVTKSNLVALGAGDAVAVRMAGKPMARFSATMWGDLKILREFLMSRMYRHSKINRICAKAEMIVQQMFTHFMDRPASLPEGWHQQVLQNPNDDRYKARTIADYIAGMTDRFAVQEHRRLFSTETMI